jgi:hypothetical protein
MKFWGSRQINWGTTAGNACVWLAAFHRKRLTKHPLSHPPTTNPQLLSKIPHLGRLPDYSTADHLLKSQAAVCRAGGRLLPPPDPVHPPPLLPDGGVNRSIRSRASPFSQPSLPTMDDCCHDEAGSRASSVEFHAPHRAPSRDWRARLSNCGGGSAVPSPPSRARVRVCVCVYVYVYVCICVLIHPSTTLSLACLIHGWIDRPTGAQLTYSTINTTHTPQRSPKQSVSAPVASPTLFPSSGGGLLGLVQLQQHRHSHLHHQRAAAAAAAAATAATVAIPIATSPSLLYDDPPPPAGSPAALTLAPQQQQQLPPSATSTTATATARTLNFISVPGLTEGIDICDDGVLGREGGLSPYYHLLGGGSAAATGATASAAAAGGGIGASHSLHGSALEGRGLVRLRSASSPATSTIAATTTGALPSLSSTPQRSSSSSNNNNDSSSGGSAGAAHPPSASAAASLLGTPPRSGKKGRMSLSSSSLSGPEVRVYFLLFNRVVILVWV